MDPSRHHGLGLQNHTHPQPEAVLSTAPASPTDEMMAHPKPRSDMHTQETSSTTTTTTMAPPHSTLAHLSFGPATQQTVVTTTTTTTVSLPPLLMKPPKDLFERDPKQYPLAFSPTPQSIRKFAISVDGKPVLFKEAEDAETSLKRYQQEQARIQAANGILRHEQEREPEYDTPTRLSKPPHVYQGLGFKKINSIRSSSAQKRTATPPSIAEAAELASLHRRTKKPRSQLHRTHSEQAEPAFAEPDGLSARRLRMDSNPSPVTPDTDAGDSNSLRASRRDANRRRSPARTSSLRLQSLQTEREDAHMAGAESQDEDSQLGPPFYGKVSSKATTSFANSATSTLDTQAPGAAATPPVAEDDAELIVPSLARTEEYRRPQLPTLLTSSQQDASLPSPSLSPITAAANLASRQNAFDHSFGARLEDEDASVVSGLDLEEREPTSKTHNTKPSRVFEAEQPAPPTFSFSQSTTASPQHGPTLMDIPTMVDAFDAMPEEMQRYVMYQLLRRCAKPTLQMVASVVNPALKCDPFNVLPAELGLNITRFLDAQSMCRAAQVSKKWRRLINADEMAWKDLLHRDEFVLPDGEITRAVKEGWGWQCPGTDGYEQDLSRKAVSPEPARTVDISDEEGDATTASSSTVVTRAKRKANVKHSSSSKKLKRKSLSSLSSTTASGLAKIVQPAWKRMLLRAHGPNACASAAAQAVPNPSVGLPSLRNMHLFKSLYQRHHLIRKAWMKMDDANPSTQPQHLAFRAHHRHVVTCLLFDSDKILTGSDDTKINVYDTKTGALRNRLEGHEGGVWALQYEGDTLVSGSTDRSVRVWDIQSGKCLQVFQGHTSTVRCLVILKPVQIGTAADGSAIMMPEEPLIITGSRDSTLRVWKLPQPGDRNVYQAGPPARDTDNPYFLRTLSGHHNSVRAIAAYGDTLISGSYDCTVRVWKISTGDLLHRLQGHTQKVYSVVLDHERQRCISGSMDNLVKVWSLETGSCLFNLEGHTSLVGLLDLSADRLVSAAADSTLRIWDPESGACRATLSAHTGAITCFQHDGQKVISGSDRTLKMWNVKTGDCVRDLLTELSGVWQVRFDERRCVAAVQRNNLTYIEVLDFGAARDGVPDNQRGRRVVVDVRGREIEDVEAPAEVEAVPAQ